MQRLTGLDAAFLSLETSAAHMQVMGVAVVDPTTCAARLLVRARPRRCSSRGCTSSRRSGAGSSRCRSVCTRRCGSRIPTSTSTTTCAVPRCPRRAARHELAAFVADVASRPLDRTPSAVGGVGRRRPRARPLRVRREDAPLADRRRVGRRDPRRRCSTSSPSPGRSVADIAPEWEPEHVPERRRAARAMPRSRSRSDRCSSSRPPTTSAAASSAASSARASARSTSPLPLTAPRAVDEPLDHAAPQGRVRVGAARRHQGGEERARCHRQRHRARHHRRRAAQLPARPRRAARSIRSSPPSRPTCAPKASASSATGCRRCSRRCPSRSSDPLGARRGGRDGRRRVEAGPRGRRDLDARGVGRRRVAGGVLARDSALRPAAASASACGRRST